MANKLNNWRWTKSREVQITLCIEALRDQIGEMNEDITTYEVRWVHQYVLEVEEIYKELCQLENNTKYNARLEKPMLTIYIVLPSYSNWALTESLVKPASGPTKTRSSCNNAFSKVDFPTFGRPTIANCSGNLDSSSSLELFSGQPSAIIK